MAVSSFPARGFSAPPSVFTAEGINSVASVTEASFKNSPVSVFNIQDLHFHPEAQNKIFSLLEKLNSSYPNFELYIEGASENSDFEWVYSSLGKKSGDVFIDALFNSGNISGAEYFAAKHGKKINAVEDKQIFDRNLILFAELIEQRTEISNRLYSLEERLATLRNKYFTSEQKKLFQAYQKYRAGSMSDSNYFDFVRKESSKNGIDINDYPNISLYILTSGSVVNVSQKKLQSQMNELFSNLKNNLSYKQYSELLTLSNNLKDRQTLMSYLYQNRETMRLDKYPELNKFIVSIALSDKLNRIEFINEEGNLLRDLFSKLSTDANSANIIFMSRFFDIYKNVLTASATVDEYKYYQDNLLRFKTLVSQYAMGGGTLASLSAIERSAEDFNDTNLQRNEIFIKKMLGNLKAPERTYPDSHFGAASNAKAVFEISAKSKVKVIVAGGFHTDGINDILNKQRINNVTFTPKITTPGKDYSFKYLEYAKLLSNAENSAIPVDIFNNSAPADMVTRVLNSLAANADSFDLSSPDIRDEVKAFVLGRYYSESESEREKKGIKITEANVFYDAESGMASIVYTDINGNTGSVTRNMKDPADNAASSVGETNLSVLGEFTAETVKKIINASGWDFTNTACSQVLNIILSAGEYERKTLQDQLKSGEFDIEKFFLGNPLELQKFVLGLFRSNILSNVSNYTALINALKESAELHLPQSKVSIRISDAPLLVNDDGWCFAALNKISDDEAELYVHTALMDKLLKLSALPEGGQIAAGYINALLQHESFETAALYGKDTPIYESFGKYLRSENLTEESRISHNFHKYLQSSHFVTFLSQTRRQNLALQQKQLLSFAKDTHIEYLGKHEEVIALERVSSFQDMNQPLMQDLLKIRIGDYETLKRYEERLKKEIEKQKEERGISNYDDFIIAFRKTTPQHIIQPIAESIAKELGITVVYINQDAYMDTGVFLREKPVVDLKNRFEISDDFDIDKEFSVNGKKSIPGKHVILIEDTQKTGSLFAAYARLFNMENAASVTPIAIFDLKHAVISSDKKEMVDSDFNFDHYMKDYIIANPEAAGRIIINGIKNGVLSKYVYHALILLIYEKKYEPFEKLARLFNSDKDGISVKATFLEMLIQTQTKYPELASSLIPLIYAIYTANPDDKNLQTSIPVICREIKEQYTPQERNTVFELKEEEYKKWDQPWLIALHAYLNGYTKIVVNFSQKEDDQAVTRKQMELLRDVCKALNINCLTRNSYAEVDLTALTEEDKKNIQERINNKELTKAVEDARKEFDRAALAQETDAAAKYKEKIKAIMAEVDDLVKDFLKSENYTVTDKDYSIVIGGSLVKGSVTSESDIYYDVIFIDRQIMLSLKDVLIPSYHYALSLTGITPYLSNGYNLNYLGEDGINPTFTQINISDNDERGVAAVFDFEQIRERKKGAGETVFEKYIAGINEEQAKEKFKELLSSIRDVSDVYYSILNSGNFLIDSKPGDTNMLTFFDNYYASAFDEQNNSQYDYRWVLRALESVLKELIIRNGADIDINSLPKQTDKLIEYMHKRNLIPYSYSNEHVTKLIEAWRTISLARQIKVAEGNSSTWTNMSAAEKESIKIIKHFFDFVRNLGKDRIIEELKPENKALIAANAFIRQRVSAREYRQIIEKLERYDFWTSRKNNFDTDTALGIMFAGMGNSEKSAELFCRELFGKEWEQHFTGIFEVIRKIKTVRGMPQYKELAGDFTLLNYMNEIIRIAGNPDHMTAIFVDKLHELINAEKRASYDLKATFFTVYIPLARRLNANFIFEEMRNAVFAETQKKEFNEAWRKLEERAGRPYDNLAEVLKLLESQLSEALYDVKSAEMHSRVKSIYSIFEKDGSSRRSEDNATPDILGLHVIVNAAEKDKAWDKIEHFFKESGSFKLRDKGFDPVIGKGFARKKIAYTYMGKQIGELILYTKEEYEREQSGLRVDSAVKFPSPHWIYKIGKEVTHKNKDGQKYADGIFEIQVAVKHLFDGQYTGSDYDAEKSFFFFSDNIVLDGDFSENFEKVRAKISGYKRIRIVKDGMTYIVRSNADANGYDALSSARLSADADMTLADENGVPIENLYEPLKPGCVYCAVKAEKPVWTGVAENSLHTLRAKMLAKLGSGTIGNMQKPSELSGIADDILSVYAHSHGLKTISELYYVLSDSALSGGFVSFEKILEFNREKGKVIYQFKITDYKGNFQENFETWVSYAEKFLTGILGNDTVSGMQIVTAESESESSSVLMTFSGDKETIDNAVAEFINAQQDLNISYFTDSKGNKLNESLRGSVYMSVRALGAKVQELFGSPLFSLLGSGIVEKTAEGLFFDVNQRILKSEVENTLDIVRSSLADGDPKYQGYDYEFIIPNSEGLARSKGSYLMAYLGVTDEISTDMPDGSKEFSGKAKLYVSEVFLRAMEGMNYAERAFYLKQVASHEATELLQENLIGSAFDYEKHHRLLRQINPDQAKLMEFAAKAAREEMERRSIEQIENEVSAVLFPEMENRKDIAVLSAKKLVNSIMEPDNLTEIHSSVWIKVTALLENSENKSAIRKELLNIIKNSAKGAEKKSIIDALSLRVPQDSYQFEAMKMFLDFVYYDIEKAAVYKEAAGKASIAARVFSKTPFAMQKTVVKKANAPEYLKSKERVFVFDIENAASGADLIAYMGSYGAKSFAVTAANYINSDDVLFTFKINVGGRDIDVRVALNAVKTERGIFYNLRYSVPFIYNVSTAVVNEKAKAHLFEAVFENSVIMEKLKEQGLDLSKSKDRLFVDRLPQDKSLTTVESISGRIAESAGIESEMRKAESRTAKKGVYNEKLPVAAMLKSRGDTGIGEITSLQKYAEDVLKPASVNGFTMYDLFAGENHLAAGNYLLLDWMSVPEALGVITSEELAADVDERESVNKEQVAKRKNLAAVKVYQKLTAEQRAEVDAYYAVNSSWLDSFAEAEIEKYKIDIDKSFFKIMAMQQMFFERQLKQTMLKMPDMDISMYIKGINTDNAGAIISKWISAGITSFTLEIDNVNYDVLKNIADAAAKSGLFINVAVKSPNMKPLTPALISRFGYTPVIPFQDLEPYKNISGFKGFKTEINGETFIKTDFILSDLLESSAMSGAHSVDYPIGLLWGEVVADSAAENYRVPAKGSKRFGGFNFGLFAVGQKTFEESYYGSYLNAVEKGLNMDVSGVSPDMDAAAEINGKFLPAAYVAALLGSLAKQNRFSEIDNFEDTVFTLINALDAKKSLEAARAHLSSLIAAYNTSADEQKEIKKAEIAGFLQGLSENIIISGVNGKFTSNAIAKVYANLTAEASLFNAGYYPSSKVSENLVPSEELLSKIKDILDRQTVAKAVSEIEPLLLNLSIPVQKNGFTFEMRASGDVVKDEKQSKRAKAVYASLTGYMLDILIDKAPTREQVRKALQVSSMEAVKSLMSAA